MFSRSILFAILFAIIPFTAIVAAETPAPRLFVPPQDPATNTLGAIDTERPITLIGQVKFVQIGPARTRVQLLVPTKGDVQEWSLEGWTRRLFITVDGKRRPVAQWDNVTMAIYLLRGKVAYGEIRAITSANGVALGQPAN